MLLKGLLVLPFVALALIHTTQAREEEKKVTDIMDSMFSKDNSYDKRIRPSFGDNPVRVGVSAYILDVYNIDEKNHEFTVQLYLRQKWTEDRLRYRPPAAVKYINLDPEHAKKIWIPDTFIVNERKSLKHDMTVANELTRIAPDGEVLRSIRTTVTASCKMDLKWFPFDRHLCSLELESYGYSMGEYFYQWEVDGQTQEPKVGISELATGTINQEVRGIRGNSASVSLSTGNYSRVAIEFLIVRTPTRYLQDVYFPAIALPIIGFITMSVGALHTRVLLSTICMVGMIIFTSLLSMEMPKVSYQTALDFYVFNSSVMILNVVLVNFVIYHLLKPTTNVKTRMRMRNLNGNADDHDAKEILPDVEPSEDFNIGRPAFTSRFQEILFGLCEKSKYSMPFFFGVFNVIYWPVVLIASSFTGSDFLLLENRN